MFTLFVLFVFAWLFVKSVGLAFHVTWGLAKFVATLLFVIALPLLVVFAVIGALLLGILETILLAALGSGYSTIAVFAVMLVFLLIRPQGIAGSNVQEKA